MNHFLQLEERLLLVYSAQGRYKEVLEAAARLEAELQTVISPEATVQREQVKKITEE